MKAQSSSRALIRKTLITQRKHLNLTDTTNKSKSVCRNVSKMNWFQRCRHIAFYMATSGEVDCSSLFQLSWKMKKNCYLPVLHPLKFNQLWLARFTPNTKLQYNRYGILEPRVKTKTRQCIPPWMLDCIIMPLVAFDDAGNRLGMGAGFYDRTLNFMKSFSSRTKPLLVGLAYEFQKVKKIVPKSWDIPLDVVVTENASLR